MEHSAPVVREGAIRIILWVYRQNGAAVVRYLPPKDAAARKNFLYKSLFNEFAKIDGTLVETQARISHPVCMCVCKCNILNTVGAVGHLDLVECCASVL